jgi:hypothetical protein
VDRVDLEEFADGSLATPEYVRITLSLLVITPLAKKMTLVFERGWSGFLLATPLLHLREII